MWLGRRKSLSLPPNAAAAELFQIYASKLFVWYRLAKMWGQCPAWKAQVLKNCHITLELWRQPIITSFNITQSQSITIVWRWHMQGFTPESLQKNVKKWQSGIKFGNVSFLKKNHAQHPRICVTEHLSATICRVTWVNRWQTVVRKTR